MRIILKVMCLPLVLITLLLTIVVKMISNISGFFFGFLTFIFLVLAGLSVLFGYNLPMAKDFLFGAGVFIAIPMGIGLIEGFVEVANSVLVRRVFG